MQESKPEVKKLSSLRKMAETQHLSLQNHTYSYILIILPPKKNENLQIKNSDVFHISAQKHRLWVLVRTASNAYVVLAEIRKNNVYPCKPHFYCIIVGFKEVKII